MWTLWDWLRTATRVNPETSSFGNRTYHRLQLALVPMWVLLGREVQTVEWDSLFLSLHEDSLGSHFVG